MYSTMERFATLLLTAFISVSCSSRILLFTAFPSHQELLLEVAVLLKTHGHQVDFLSYQTDVEEIRERTFPVHLVKPSLNLSIDYAVDDAASLTRPYSTIEEHRRLQPVLKTLASLCSHLLDNPDLQQRIQAQNYSLLFLDLYANDLCPTLLARKLGIPVIGFWPWSLSLPASYFMGVPSLPSFVPTVFTSYQQEMSWTQRIGNLFATYYELKRWQDEFYAIAEDTIRQHIPKYSSALELYGDISLLLTNEHLVLEYARPSLPNIIPVGGFHCQLAQPLMQSVEEFVKKFRGGIILITLSKSLHHHSEIVDVFSKISTHAVLWEMFSGTRSSESGNILKLDSVARQDVLGHQRMRLFVSSCDATDVMAAIFHGVPILCVPVTSHQFITSLRVTERHLGLMINKFNLTKVSLLEGLQRLLNNKRYMAHTRQASLQFRDQPEVPSDRLIYWVEYVIRNKGVPTFMTSNPSRHLSVSQYYFVDLIVIVTVLMQLVTFILLSLGYLLYKIAWRPGSQRKGKME